MQRTKSKILSILLSLVMLLSLLPTTALAAGNPDPTAVSVNGGISFSSSNLYYTNGASACSNNSTGWNAAYDPTTGTLTLDGYSGGSIRTGGTDADITVVLKGTNTINDGSLMNDMGGDITITSNSVGTLSITNTLSNSNPAIGIEAGLSGSYQTGNVTITGDAKVTINMTNNGTSTWEKAYGIYAKENITISGDASVDITCKTPYNTARFGDYCNGLYAKNNVTIDTSGTIKIDVKNAGGDDAYSFGIYPMSGATLTKVGNMEVQWKKGVSSGGAVYKGVSFDTSTYAVYVDEANCTATYTPKGTTPTTITGELAVAIAAPVKGKAPQSTIAATEQYTGTIAWEGNPTTFAADTAYTAKVELTANTGYQFASDVNPTVTDATISEKSVSADGKTLTFKATFPATTDAVVTKVQIASTPPSLNVPEADGIDKPGTVKVTNTYSVTVHTDSGLLSNPSGVVWSISDLDGVTVDPTTGNMTISSDCPGGKITLTATYGGVSSTPANLTVWRATSAAKWLKIVDPATGGEPQTTIMRPVGTALTDWIQVEYKAKVYDQFSQPVNITDIEWTTNPSAIKIGTTDLVDEGIRQIRVSHNTEAIPFDLTAALKTDPTIKGTVTIKVEEKTLETLTVTQADTTYGTALSDPVFTKPEGTIKTLVHYSTPTSSAYSSDTPPTNAGEYVVNVVCETATHIYTGHANFKINQKSISNMLQDITGTYTYTGAPQKPTAVVKDGTKPLVEGTDYTVRYGTNVHVFEAATVYVDGIGNYTGTFSRNFKIQPKPIDITSVSTTNRDYEEGRLDVDCTVTLPVASNVKQGEHYHVYATMDDDTAGTNKTVNVLVKMEKGCLGENYTLNKDTTTATVTINQINPADPTGLKGVKGQKLSTVELPAGWNWDAPATVMNTAGTQTFHANYAGDANHNALHMHLITVNVLDKTDVSAFITFPDGEKEYTGSWMEYKEATISGTNLGTGAKWNYVYAAGTGTLMAAGFPEGIGTYTVTATYEDSINFGIATATLTIVPKKVAIPAADTTVFTYDGNAKTYGISDTADYTVTGNSQTNAGDHTVTVALKDKATTAWADGTTADKTYTFTIKQATPTGEPAYTKITTSGKKLSDAALTTTGGTFSVPGTVKWVDDTGAALPGTTTVEANKLYKWVFTPNDSTNYESINGSIKLWSKSTSSGGGGSYYAPVVPDMPMVYWGCTGDAVKTLQEKLNAKGFHSGNVDGIFGAKTYAAVTAFQKANSLGVDGIVGKLTWAKLYDATPVNVTPVTTQPMLRTGSRGDAVRKLQELLNAKGYTCGSVDGIFGSKTYAAVLAFQKANGLGADGIVGPLTWAKLG